MKTLNDEQKIIADKIFEFLLDDEKELIISGPGGSGKTFMMGHIVDTIIPQYETTCRLTQVVPKYHEIAMTALTNKAAEVLSQVLQRSVSTIHSFLNLTVKNDYSTGGTKLVKKPNYEIHRNIILFIDEASGIDFELLKIIRESVFDSKIIYVCDSKQTGPIFETISPIFSSQIQEYKLTKVERNKTQPVLQDLCTQVRATVDSLDFQPIKTVPGVVEHLSPEEMQQTIIDTFKDPGVDARILAYTNKRVRDYNAFIREIRGYVDPYVVGERLVNNSAIGMGTKDMIPTEAVVVVSSLGKTYDLTIKDGIAIQLQKATLLTTRGDHIDTSLPLDKTYYDNLLRYFKRQKDWMSFFKLKNNIPDLRSCEAITIHKAQGSTYETVFIDCTDLGTCTNPLLAARMLYVAVSRPTTKIYLYGELPERFGGIT